MIMSFVVVCRVVRSVCVGFEFPKFGEGSSKFGKYPVHGVL
jgi:hypothetical protein